MHGSYVLATQHGLEVLGEAGVFGGGVGALEVDEGVEGVDPAQPLRGITAMGDGIGNLVINNIVERCEMVGRKICK